MGTKKPKISAKKPKVKLKRLSYSVDVQNQFDDLEPEENKTDNSKKSKKPSPIIVTENLNDIDKVIKTLKINYRKKIIGVGVKIFTDTAVDKKAIEDSLRTSKTGYYTHPEATNKIFKAVISGLPDIDTEEIKRNLETSHALKPQKIIKMGKFDTKKYLVHFNKDETNMAALNKISVIYNHIIKWIPYQYKNRGPTQCYRCSMYGHGANFCHRRQICFLCSGDHDMTVCRMKASQPNSPANTQTLYRCFNCANNGLPHNHKASDKSCPFRVRYLEVKEKMRSLKTNERKNVIYREAPIPPPLTKSYAATAASGTHPNSMHNTPAVNLAAQTSVNDLWSFEEVTEILFNSISELQKCSTKLDQLKVISTLLSHACK